jgi:hypothetical protein
MPRIRSRRAHELRHDWPLTAEQELATGIDLAPFITKLGRFFAQHAQTPAALEDARAMELRLRHLYDR